MNVFETILVHHGAKEIDYSINIKPVGPSNWVKPESGFWASPELATHTSCWTKWCEEECYSHSNCKVDECIRFKISKDARVCVIDNFKDLINLSNECAVDEKITKSIMTSMSKIDWVKAAELYDVVYLTENGQWATKLTRPCLYGWDMESCVVFDYDAIEVI